MKKKISKLLSIVLTVAILMSTCLCAMGTVSANTPIYYVSPTGNDEADGTEYENPLQTVAKAIEKANDLGLGEGDTVYLKLLYDASVYNDWGTNIETHTFTLNVSPADGKRTGLGTGASVVLTGPCVFDNIYLATSQYKSFDFGGNDVKLINGAYFYHSLDLLVYNNNTKYSGSDIDLYFGSDSQTKTVYLAGNSRTPTMDCNFNITIDNNSTSNYIRIGNNGGTNKPTYNKNINFNIIKATNLTVNTKLNNDVVCCNFAPGSAIQFINSAGIDLATNKEFIVNYYKDTNGEQVPYYIINNNLGIIDAIEFTKTAGKYKVNLDPDKYDSISLVSADGTIEKELEEDGTITVTQQGEYTLRASRSVTYYIKPDADITDPANNGLYPETPLKSVNGVIAAAKAAGYGEGDTVYIKAIKTFDTDGTTEIPNLWDDNAAETITQHDFKLDISSYEKNTARIGTTDITLNGDVDFSNITIFNRADTTVTSHRNFATNNHNVSFGEGTTFYNDKFQLFASSSTPLADFDLYFACEMPSYFVFGGCYRSFTYGATENEKINVNVTVNSGKDNWFGLGVRQTDRDDPDSTTYNYCNLNFNLKSTSNFRIATAYGTPKFTSNAAIQVINSTGDVELLNKAPASGRDPAIKYFKTLKTDTGKDVKYFIINNNTGNKDAIEFTKTAGKYKVNLDTDFYDVELVDASDETKVVATLDSDGYLTVTEKGVYTLKTTKKKNLSVTYYVSPTGNDEADGTEYKTPLKTVAKAVEKANDLGLGEGDTVYLKLLYDASVYNDWGTNIETHTFTLNVSPADGKITRLGTGASVVLTGPCVFDNIYLATSLHNSFDFRGNDVKLINGAYFYHSLDLLVYNNNTGYSGSDIDLYFGSDSQTKTVYLAGNSKTPTMDCNFNITIDNSTSNYIKIGNNGGTEKPTYKKNINFNIKNAGSLTVNTKLNNDDVACCKFAPGSAIQFINSAGIDLTTNKEFIVNYYKDTNGEQVPYYIINNKSGIADVLAFTDVAGEYTVNYDVVPEGYIVILKDTSTNQEEIIEDNTITVSKGIYELRVVSNYTNDGEKISVYKPCKIDLSQENALEKDGKLFIGWQKADDTWPNTTADYVAGDVLTAKYIDFTLDTVAYDSSAVDFAIDNITLTEDGGLKLNLGFTNTTALDDYLYVSEKGVIWVETDYALGHELRVDENIVRSWTWDSKGDINAFTPNKTLDAPNKVVNSNTASIEITDDAYNTYYTARGYIKYTDNNGIESIIYTVEETSSAYKVASEATDSKTIYSTIIEKVKADNKTFVDSLTETVVAVYDKSNPAYKRNTDSYDVFSNITGAGDYVKYKRDTVLTNTGVKETINLGWITDMHIFGVSQTDVDKQMTNILATYRGSAWLRYPTRKIMERANDQMNYMTKRFTKTIVTGDVSDNYSYGSYNAVKALVGDKSVNGSVLMTTGNHEFFEKTKTDISGLTDQFTTAQKYDLINQSWANDPYYYSEILKTSKGEDNAMIILLDNGSGEYPVGTATKLQASIDEAKQKNIPVLIFQHIPMSTYNSTETKVCKGTTTSMGFATSGDTINMSSYDNDGNEVLEVQAIVRKNYDIIKGVFAGHTHLHFYTEITAIDENGNIIEGEYIPQFITGGADQDCFWVNEITLKADGKPFEGNYEENFNEKTTNDLTDWTMDDASTVEDGKLNLGSSMVNNSITSYNQYISVDVKSADLSGGFEIRARINGDNYYSFNILSNALQITKSNTAVATDDSFVFDGDKLYRVSLSVVDDVVTAYIHDYTDDKDGGIVKTLSYTDENACDGSKFGFVTESSGVKLDNVYFSTEAFKANDDGWVENDINGDRTFNICDLVYVDQNTTTNEDCIIARADKNKNKLINQSDINLVRRFILGIFEVTYYVSPTGDDTNIGTEYNAPLKTVAKAIEKANDLELGEGYNVYLKLLYDASYNDWGTNIEAHTFTLNVSPADGKRTGLGTGAGVVLTGPCVFDNIYLYVTGNNVFDFNGKTVKFINDAKFNESGVDVAVYNSYGTYDADDINLYFGSDSQTKTVYLAGNYKNHTMDCNFNITIDNSISNTIKIGNNAGPDKPTYKKNINFNIKNAGSLTVNTKLNNDVACCKFAPGSAIQFINSAGIDLTTNKEFIVNYYKDTNGEQVPYYIVNPDSTLKDSIKFTNTAGVFALSDIDTSIWNVVVKKDGTQILENITTELDLRDYGYGEYVVEVIEK